MAKLQNEKQYLAFIKGLITEANALTYPEGATLDEDNFVLKRDGSRERRLGLDFSQDSTAISFGSEDSSVAGFYLWEYAGGGETTLGVVRVGNKLWFLDMLADSPTLSLKNGGNTVSIAVGGEDIDVATINNSLVVVSQGLSLPLLLSYNTLTDTVSSSSISIQVRDIWGVDDGLSVENRPTTLTNEHKYNLQNQGWIDTISTVCGTDPIECTKTKLTVYPSNSDIWTLGKIGIAGDNFEKYSPDSLKKNSQDWMEAPKGKYVLDAFNRGASRESKSTVTGLPTDSESGRLSTVAAFSGRIFYSGVKSTINDKDDKSPNYSGYVFFSQSVTNNDKLGKCYQEADPTSDTISDLIDTDGGAIYIPEASHIHKVLSAKSSLLIFAENGIWEVFAGDAGFKATEYQLAKISNIGITNPKAVVESNDSIAYWTKFGIYILAPDKVTGRMAAQNISLPTIQTFYQSIPEEGKANARGYFEEREGRIRWLYNDSLSYEGTSNYNKELILDTTLQAFYPHSTPATSVWLADYVTIPNYTAAGTTDLVYVGTDLVLVGTEEVETVNTTTSPRESGLAFLSLDSSTFSISEYHSPSFSDWGTNFSSYLVTGYEIFGDMMRKKQTPYALFFFKKTETGVDESMNPINPSSCLVQAQWNWANSATSGKWGNQFQAYRFNRNYIPEEGDDLDTGDSIIVSKNKLRGTGRSLSLKLQSEAGKDMRVLGWAVRMTGQTLP